MNPRGGVMGRVVAVLATLALGLLVLPPIELLDERFIGIGGVDHPGTLWFHAAVRRALGGAGSLLRTADMYWPYGQDLLHTTGDNVVDALLGAPFAAFGPVTGHNLFLLAVLAANGATAGWLARRSGTPAASLTALTFTLAPYPLYELIEGRPAQALLAVFLATLALFPAVVRGERPPWLLGLALALLGYQYWFYGIFCGFMLGAGAMFYTWRPPADRTRAQVLRALGLAFGVSAAVVSPVVVPLLGALGAGRTPGMMDPSAPTGLLLYTFQPLLGVVGYLDGERFVGTQRAVPVALLATVVGVATTTWRQRRGARGQPDLARELAMGAVALLLAVGPVLVVGSHLAGEPAYVALATTFTPLRRLWHPSRALAGLVALGALWVARLPAWGRVLVCALTIGEVWRDGLLPLPTWSAAVPAGYQCLAQRDDETDGAVVELPWAVSQRHLWYQAVHLRPILGGFHEGAPGFQPTEAVALRAEPFLSALIAAARGVPSALASPDLAESSSRLGSLGFRYVLLQKDELPAGDSPGERARRRRVEAGLESMMGVPLYDDARVSFWSPWGAPRPCATAPAPDATVIPTVEVRRVRELGERSLSR